MNSSPVDVERIFEIDLRGCEDKAAVLERFAVALDFPAWFGHNWDALADALGDLSWLDPRPGQIRIRGLDEFSLADPVGGRILGEIVDDSAASAGEHPLLLIVDEGNDDSGGATTG